MLAKPSQLRDQAAAGEARYRRMLPFKGDGTDRQFRPFWATPMMVRR
jgi:hypothetical protein